MKLQKLYRLYNPASGDHFYTASESERDWAIEVAGYGGEGDVGFVADAPSDSGSVDTMPLYRLYNPESGDHFYTTAADERDWAASNLGYNDEGIAGHVFGSQLTFDYVKMSATTTPLYRLYKASNCDHFYTTSEAERDEAVANAGYGDEGIGCFVVGSFFEG